MKNPGKNEVMCKECGKCRNLVDICRHCDRMKTWKARPFSWSQLSSFEYDPEQWFKSYFLGEKEKPSREMLFGSAFAKSIEHGTCAVPGLLEALQKRKEYPFKVMYEGIALVGFADAFNEETLRDLDEVKTGKAAWTQKRVDEHGQITMYCFMNYIAHKVKAEEVRCRLFWLPTRETGDFEIDFVRPVKPVCFSTKRSMKDCLRFGGRINNTRHLMERFAQDHD